MGKAIQTDVLIVGAGPAGYVILLYAQSSQGSG